MWCYISSEDRNLLPVHTQNFAHTHANSSSSAPSNLPPLPLIPPPNLLSHLSPLPPTISPSSKIKRGPKKGLVSQMDGPSRMPGFYPETPAPPSSRYNPSP